MLEGSVIEDYLGRKFELESSTLSAGWIGKYDPGGEIAKVVANKLGATIVLVGDLVNVPIRVRDEVENFRLRRVS